MTKLIKAARLIRKELLVLDEPLKAYHLLDELVSSGIKELETDLANTYGMIRHLFEPDTYTEIYHNDTCKDYEKIEPELKSLVADTIYPRYSWILQEMEANKAKSLIDLACYVGSLPLTASKKGFKATGVDFTRRAIEVAKERAEKFGIDTEFVCSDILDYNGEKADAVSANEVIEHVTDPKKLIEKMLSLVNDGGWCYVTTPNGPFGNGSGNSSWEWNGEGVRGHVRVFVGDTMRGLLDECGCEGEIKGMPDGLLWVKFRKKT